MRLGFQRGCIDFNILFILGVVSGITNTLPSLIPSNACFSLIYFKFIQQPIPEFARILVLDC